MLKMEVDCSLPCVRQSRICTCCWENDKRKRSIWRGVTSETCCCNEEVQIHASHICNITIKKLEKAD